jgi:hypothetical protein
MKNTLLIIFLFISVTSFAQKNYVGIDLFPIGKSFINGGNYELIYQRQLENNSIINFKLYNATTSRRILTNSFNVDSCSRLSYYKDSDLLGIRLGYGHNLFSNTKISIYTGGAFNFTYVRGIIYVDDYNFCDGSFDNHNYSIFDSPKRTNGILLGIVPTINLQYQFWKNFVLSATLGLELNYESSQRGYVNLDGELMTYGYTGFLSDFNRNYLIQDIAILYRF